MWVRINYIAGAGVSYHVRWDSHHSAHSYHFFFSKDADWSSNIPTGRNQIRWEVLKMDLQMT